MTAMNEKAFSGIDLNLLVVFAVVMRERSATRAAERLFLTQSAVSHALRRLRAAFDDELFVRASQGVAPTPRAEALYRDILPCLETIETTLGPPAAFVPESSHRTFRLGLPSALDVSVTPALLAQLAAVGPHMSLVVRPADFQTGLGKLDSGEIDVGVSHFPAVERWQRSRPLGTYNYACLFDGERLGLSAPVSLEQYLAHPHVLPSFSGDTSGAVDTVLAEHNLQRRVLVATPDFASIPFYLTNTRSMATMPTYAARIFADRLGLTYSVLPFAMPDFPVSMIWHARLDADTGQTWFRDTVASIVAAL
jgi:LysR family transcriptional activator of mexEF-oprN operon